MAGKGDREGPAAKTDAALTCFHNDCDTTLVDSIVVIANFRRCLTCTWSALNTEERLLS